jgi:drug/metabolite transporter (DMT)-like permease
MAVNHQVVGKRDQGAEIPQWWDCLRGQTWMLHVAGLTVLWAAMEAAAASISRHYHPIQIVGMRYAGHLLLIAAWCLLSSNRRPLSTAYPVLQLLRGACMFVTPAAFVMGAASVPAGSVWALFWTAPIVAVGLARMVLGERCETVIWVALLVSFGSALLILDPKATGVRLELAWPVLASAAFAAYVILSRALRGETLISSLTYTGLGAFCGVVPWMLAEWRPVRTDDLVTIGAIAGAGLLFLAWLDRALEAAPVRRIAPLLYMVVFWEVAIECLWLRELPSATAVTGAVFWLAAVWMATCYERPPA